MGIRMGLRHRGVLYWESERDLIVSILTREVVGGKLSQDLFFPPGTSGGGGTT